MYTADMGTLFIVGTPIGNLEDLTYRSVRVLREVDLIAAEDTRVTRKLLNHLDIHVPLVSYHEHNYRERTQELLLRLQDGNVALVTDAGMPCISDPGSDLISKASEQGYSLELVPGVSAVTTAVAGSGFSADNFYFLGFLSRKKKLRQEQLQQVKHILTSIVIFESPHRIKKTLSDISEILGNCRISVCREMTKLHEEIFMGTVNEAIEHFSSPRGEFVLVIQNKSAGTDVEDTPDFDSINAELVSLRQEGYKAKDAVGMMVLSTGLSRKTLYDLWIASSKKG
jgi:16S rRNA (cytidine1402-2'-O)-methyltransferase